ncbi:MAG: aldolase/citrate lyase family protein [Bacillota bacterium]
MPKCGQHCKGFARVAPDAFRKAVAEDRVLVGPFVKLPSPQLVEILGAAGFDFAIFDMEHGALSMESIESLVRSADVAGITPIVRIPEGDLPLISRVLDVGARGVVVPHICDARTARDVVKYAKFAPQGERSICRFVRAAAFSARDPEDYLAHANDETVVIGMLEGLDGIANLDEIVAVPGIDVVFVGPYDLSQALGIPGRVTSHQVVAEMKRIVDCTRSVRKMAGVFVDNLRAAEMWIQAGVRFIAYMVDVGIYHEACRKIVEGVTRIASGGALHSDETG